MSDTMQVIKVIEGIAKIAYDGASERVREKEGDYYKGYMDAVEDIKNTVAFVGIKENNLQLREEG